VTDLFAAVTKFVCAGIKLFATARHESLDVAAGWYFASLSRGDKAQFVCEIHQLSGSEGTEAGIRTINPHCEPADGWSRFRSVDSRTVGAKGEA